MMRVCSSSSSSSSVVLFKLNGLGRSAPCATPSCERALK